MDEQIEIAAPWRMGIAVRAGEIWEIDGEPHRMVEIKVSVGSDVVFVLERVNNPWRDLRIAMRCFRDDVAKELLQRIDSFRKRVIRS